MYFINRQAVSETDYRAAEKTAKEDALQGVFETMLCAKHHLPLKSLHQERLTRSLNALGLKKNVSRYFAGDIEQLDLPDRAVLKYQWIFSSDFSRLFRLLEIRDLVDYPASYTQQGISVMISALTMQTEQDSGGRKSINRDFYQRVENEYSGAGCAEGIILNGKKQVVEGSKTNVFGIKDTCLITPDLGQGGVAGVMRASIVQTALQLGLSVRIETVTIDDLLNMQAVFLTNAVVGIWPVKCIMQATSVLRKFETVDPMIKQLQQKLPLEFVNA